MSDDLSYRKAVIEAERMIALQEARLKNEHNLDGWDSCRFLDHNLKRCNAIPLYGGYCSSHMLEYPFPNLVEEPRNRWRDSSVISSSLANLMKLLSYLKEHDQFEIIISIIPEVCSQFEDDYSDINSLAFKEAMFGFHDWISIQQLQFRVYISLQGLHDVSYEYVIEELTNAGLPGLVG